MGILVLLFVILGMATFISIRYQKKIGVTIPISIMINILVVYLFGLFNLLDFGANVILFASFLFYSFSLILFCKSNEKKSLLKFLFTPVLAIWIAFVIFFMLYYRGAVLSWWDEFTHWGDVVKMMYLEGVLSSNHASMSYFSSYPPANSIFLFLPQYYRGEFVQYVLYVAQQIICISFTLSFLEKNDNKSFLKTIGAAIFLFMLPSVFYNYFFSTIYVDQFLGIIFFYGITSVYLNSSHSKFNLINWCLIAAFLPLIKDVGKFLGVVLIILICYKIYIENEHKPKDRLKQVFKRSIPVISSFSMSILSWKVCLHLNKASLAFSEPVDVKVLLNSLIGNDISYKSDVVKNFIEAIRKTVIFTVSGIDFNIVACLVLITILSFYNYANSSKKSEHKTFMIILFSFFGIYLFGMLTAYIFRFSEYEALTLASFTRYVSIYLLPLFMFVCVFIISAFIRYNNRNITLIMLVIFTMFCRWDYFITTFYNKKVIVNKMEIYDTTSKDILNKLPKGKHKVNFVTTKSAGYEYWVMRFYTREKLESFDRLIIGVPNDEKDMYTKKISVAEWEKTLELNDYVFLYDTDEDFINLYNSLFESKDSIKDRTLYKIVVEKERIILKAVK
ncbi:MAG: hypothetical protein RR646_05965 [Erysipelotrichaceae bacterium]